MIDHIHMMISIPPKYSVSKIVGFLKGKTALYIAQKYGKNKETLEVKTFGLEVILFLPLAETKQ